MFVHCSALSDQLHGEDEDGMGQAVQDLHRLGCELLVASLNFTFKKRTREKKLIMTSSNHQKEGAFLFNFTQFSVFAKQSRVLQVFFLLFFFPKKLSHYFFSIGMSVYT